MQGVSEVRLFTSGPLKLLRKVRDVMASSDPAQDRLDRLVRLIATDFNSEVCSIYLLRAGDLLELYANVGLNQTAVHLTRLSVGEGLVGEIAAHGFPINLADAPTHPKFAYRPETGEERYHSFVGVPILHSGKVMGVLVVQSVKSQSYSDDQLEVLQTVAMVLAELTVSGQLVSIVELAQGAGDAQVMQHLTGMKLASGLASATAVLHNRRVEIVKFVSEDPSLEEQRLQKALTELQHSVDELIKASNFKQGDEQLEIMETYRMFIRDRGWVEQILEAIREGLTAEAAVRRTQEQLHARMDQMSSQYIKERIQDLEDLSNRLLQHLSGETTQSVHARLPEKFVLVARAMGPAELLEYGRNRLLGLVLEEGSATSHIVIIARAMDIPVVGRVADATQLIKTGDPLIVDGDSGEVYLRPSEDVEALVAERIEQNKRRNEAYASTRDLPSITKDGVVVSLNINVGLLIDMKQMQEPDVDGIGLYRTELPYLVASGFPNVASQAKVYGKIIRQAAGKRVVFRTFDIGGDKQLPYFKIDGEENPAMGWRATRIGIDRPAILRQQFRALIQAGAEHELDIMFPFITEVSEFDEVKKLLDAELNRARQNNQPMPAAVRTGAMIEVPAILWQLPGLLKRLDFVSIGSNDLLQFLFACDRGSPRLSDRYDPVSPVVINVLRHIVAECEKAGVSVGFCGEMASRPLEAMVLVGSGIRHLSMPPSAISPVKAMIRSIDSEELKNYIGYLATLDDHSVRGALAQFARDHGVDI